MTRYNTKLGSSQMDKVDMIHYVLTSAVGEGLMAITATEWKNCVDHVISTEEKYWTLDVVTDDMAGPFIISLSNTDDETNTASEGSHNLNVYLK